jgi:23S rRNA pseudouridine955/2504/2580 synthase
MEKNKSPRTQESKVKLIRVLVAHEGQRIDNYLLRYLKGVPRSRIYRIIRRGEVRINKKRCKPESKLHLGDEIRIPPVSVSSGPAIAKPSPGLAGLLLESILFENEDLIILNKPAGLAVHGGTGIRLGLIEALRQLKPEWSGLELAHRLDRDTSGCILISKNSIFLKEIQAKFKAREIRKCYLALVVGNWPSSLTEVDVPLQKNELSSGERIVKVAAEGKDSLTYFKTIAAFSQATLVEARPLTGRTHQIRVHCQYAGFPILGDEKYGAKTVDVVLKGHKNLCLHASSIQFEYGLANQKIMAEAELNLQIQGVLENLKNIQ